jgi:RNA polymerase sigma factor (sigma-70 family)
MTTAIRPYLLVCLRRKVLKQIGKEQKSEALSDFGEYGNEEAAEALLIQGEQAAFQTQKLQAAMAQLSDRQREAIFLKYYEELEYQEVAEMMNINYQSVRNLIFSGIKKMREILAIILFILIFFDWV